MDLDSIGKSLIGKTIQAVVLVSEPEQDFDIIFTDGQVLSVRAIGDDMAYTSLRMEVPHAQLS